MYGLELAEACRMFMQDIMRVKNGETVAIVSDTGSDMSVVTACADVSSQLGAEPIVMNSAMREDVTMDPPKPVAESLMHVDVVVVQQNKKEMLSFLGVFVLPTQFL
mgnify:CR=1 FL=1